jgi:hypothetical protein
LLASAIQAQKLTVTVNDKHTHIATAGALFGNQMWGHSVEGKLSFENDGCSEAGESAPNVLAVLIERGTW